MFRARELRPGIFWVGALDPDRQQFDALTPLPEGTSYNSYVIRGQTQTALIDTAEPARAAEFFGRLESLQLPRLDLVISNHAEQDHSGLLPEILRRYPEARLLATPKARKLLPDLLDLPLDRFDEVADGETRDLGGRTLQFWHAPWVHWPETMMTLLPEERILFSGDLFGSHLATHDLFLADPARVEQAASRYYAEIMSPFRAQIRKYLERIATIDLELIAPSHGPIHHQPAAILTQYRRWTREEPEPKVVIVYTSMHGSTRQMVDHLTGLLLLRGVQVEVINVEEMDAGRLCMAIVDAATLVVGSPMVLAGPHPKALYAVALIGALRPKLRFASFLGSYGWGGKLVEPFSLLLDKVKLEILPPVLAQGVPRAATLEALEGLADTIVQRHATLAPRHAAPTPGSER
ncbi:MAG: FprA family A-type flavoprotein [Myxococcota bacterium]|jgi:flavorubredoxin|nr:FprA family A-type flavoprotein [Myxococcota bacterium]